MMTSGPGCNLRLCGHFRLRDDLLLRGDLPARCLPSAVRGLRAVRGPRAVWGLPDGFRFARFGWFRERRRSLTEAESGPGLVAAGPVDLAPGAVRGTVDLLGCRFVLGERIWRRASTVPRPINATMSSTATTMPMTSPEFTPHVLP